jgi:prevent-host-death family protein
MTPIAAYEAENTLDSLLDRAEAGEQILITRHGKPVARLIPEWKAYRDEGRR